ncbi:ImmA/IrrE family metallo-endopeptidase [candidate division WWE3 bacterium]|nr:ImmA/IrrE family metallo-endopeptidase [candidate division WWE3 bacterium]
MKKTQKITKKQILNKALENLSPEGSVDITKLSNSLGIEVYEYPFDKDISGAVTKKDDGTCSIYVTKSDPLTRKRFSIAHELAHYVLHPDLLEKNGVIHRGSKSDTNLEEEANKLAEEILIPSSLAVKFLESLGIKKAASLSAGIIDQFAKRFKVSRYVAIIRLRNLNYNVPYIYYS